ncbi:MAG: ACR3 family arsenite efflux transporter [Flavobacteriales bacterium]|nr:ACR3 family arsenite efflux transporter [Flavobacteriales bacterium]
MKDTSPLGFFERYLTIWVALCIAVGVGIGVLLGDRMEVLSGLNMFGINLPITILVWLMIFPMMLQVDLSKVGEIGRQPKGILLTLVINWLIKPFSMAFIAWLFFSKVFAAWLTPEQAEQYLAGAILLGVAPCTAMVFVWSYLTKGNPLYTLVQVSINDLIILIAFIPLVGLLLGVSGVEIPYSTLVTSVILFVAVPLLAGYLVRRAVLASKGQEWFEKTLLPAFKPVSIIALLTTLLLLFAFQGETIIGQPLVILLIAVPLTIQTYLIFFVTWGAGRWLKLPHNVCAPASMIGASNFFELAVAVAIALFGLHSGAALATVVGVLIEVPVMLSLVALANRWRY